MVLWTRDVSVPPIKMESEFPRVLLRTETALVREEIEYDKADSDHLGIARYVEATGILRSAFPLVSKGATSLGSAT